MFVTCNMCLLLTMQPYPEPAPYPGNPPPVQQVSGTLVLSVCVFNYFLAHVLAQGVKQSVLSVVVVCRTKST